MAASLPRVNPTASGKPVGSISSRGSIGHQWAQTICQESSPPEIRAGWGESRARVPGSQPAVGVDAPPVCPRDASDWTGLTAAARPPGYQSSRRANNAAFRVQCMELCGARGSKESRFDADQFVTNAGVLCFVRNPAL